MLKIYNTKTKKKEIFKPIIPGKINMYVCGMTIYDLCHLGHARTFIVFDMIARYFRYLGYQLKYIRNITDIDDKIIKKANKNKETCYALSKRMLKEMNKDFSKLNIIKPNLEPKVTDHINDIISFIKILIQNKNAYISKNGDVMFSIKTYKRYGELSKQNINKLIFNQKKLNINEKENKLDFVLWKKTKNYEPHWLSPWGIGRPGWHIECSAINIKYFGNHFDIHGGGIDLKFPHHENEIAQSVCAYHGKYVNYWIHTGMILVNKKKMSKSKNNFFTLQYLFKKYDPETIRYFLLSANYSSQLNFEENDLKKSYNSLKYIYKVLEEIKINQKKDDKSNCNEIENIKMMFLEAMNDNFNTPKIYSLFFYLIKEIKKFKNSNISIANDLTIQFYKFGNILGLFQKTIKCSLNNDVYNDKNKIRKIEEIIEERNYARKKKSWNKADLLRNKLSKMGIILEDNKDKTKWYFKDKK
ncbi:MAG: cysteine--tRNA ligase [Arsenophonus sp.]|nr:MAG: cysteine--tRNA ligase [Arsenophonus sp.]